MLFIVCCVMACWWVWFFILENLLIALTEIKISEMSLCVCVCGQKRENIGCLNKGLHRGQKAGHKKLKAVLLWNSTVRVCIHLF